MCLFDGGLYLDPFTAVYCCRAVLSEDANLEDANPEDANPYSALASGPQTSFVGGGVVLGVTVC